MLEIQRLQTVYKLNHRLRFQLDRSWIRLRRLLRQHRRHSERHLLRKHIRFRQLRQLRQLRQRHRCRLRH